ncbi:unnamed protein product, partial [Sphacelaria rigidula]
HLRRKPFVRNVLPAAGWWRSVGLFGLWGVAGTRWTLFVGAEISALLLFEQSVCLVTAVTARVEEWLLCCISHDRDRWLRQGRFRRVAGSRRQPSGGVCIKGVRVHHIVAACCHQRYIEFSR